MTEKAVKAGLMPLRPDDDTGMIAIFVTNFITPEMREAMPKIASEFLRKESLLRDIREIDDSGIPKYNDTNTNGIIDNILTSDGRFKYHVPSVMDPKRIGDTYF